MVFDGPAHLKYSRWDWLDAPPEKKKPLPAAKNPSGSPRLTLIKSSTVLASPAKTTSKPMFLKI
jgi:hypothetical protein